MTRFFLSDEDKIPRYPKPEPRFAVEPKLTIPKRITARVEELRFFEYPRVKP